MSCFVLFWVGNLYQHHLGFEERMCEALRMLLDEEVEKRV